MCRLQIHFCPIYWFYVLLSCHWIILAISWSRWTAMTEERSVTDPVSARWGRRKLEKVINMYCSASCISIELWCRLPWGFPWFQRAVRADPWTSTECFWRRLVGRWRTMLPRRGCSSRRRRGRLSWGRVMITSMTWRKIWLHQPSSRCSHRNLAEPQCGHYGDAWKVCEYLFWKVSRLGGSMCLVWRSIE